MRFPIAATLSLLVGGCGPAAPTGPRDAAQPAATDAAAHATIERDVADIQANVTRSSETQRLDELERRIGRLEATPDKLDLELLASRVQALEAKAGIDGLATMPTPVPGTAPRTAPATVPGAPPAPAAKSPSVRKPAPKPVPSPRPSPSAPGTASGTARATAASGPDAR